MVVVFGEDRDIDGPSRPGPGFQRRRPMVDEVPGKRSRNCGQFHCDFIGCLELCCYFGWQRDCLDRGHVADPGSLRGAVLRGPLLLHVRGPRAEAERVGGQTALLEQGSGICDNIYSADYFESGLGDDFRQRSNFHHWGDLWDDGVGAEGVCRGDAPNGRRRCRPRPWYKQTQFLALKFGCERSTHQFYWTSAVRQQRLIGFFR